MTANNFEQFQISQCCVIIRDGAVLVLEDAANPGKWLLPGGRIDKGEERETALRRELKEEIGCTDFEVKGVADFDAWYNSSGIPKAAVVYLATLAHYDIRLSPEHLQYQWVLPEDLHTYSFFWPNGERMIQRAFALNRLLQANAS